MTHRKFTRPGAGKESGCPAVFRQKTMLSDTRARGRLLLAGLGCLQGHSPGGPVTEEEWMKAAEGSRSGRNAA